MYIVVSLRLVWNKYLNTRPKTNVWKPGWKQAGTCKFFTLFQNFTDLGLKNNPFSWFRELAPPSEKSTSYFRENGYEHRCTLWSEVGDRELSSTTITQRSEKMSASGRAVIIMMTSSNGNIFRVTGPLCGEWREGLVFSLIRASTNDWVNNRGAGDLRRHPIHNDVTIMIVCHLMKITYDLAPYLRSKLSWTVGNANQSWTTSAYWCSIQGIGSTPCGIKKSHGLITVTL